MKPHYLELMTLWRKAKYSTLQPGRGNPPAFRPLAAVKRAASLARSALIDLSHFCFVTGAGHKRGRKEGRKEGRRGEEDFEIRRVGQGRGDVVFYGSMAKNESMEFGAIFAPPLRRIMIRGCNTFPGFSFWRGAKCDTDALDVSVQAMTFFLSDFKTN